VKPSVVIAEALLADRTKLSLRTHDGHYHLRVGSELLMSTTASHSEEQMADLAIGGMDANAPKRVLIGGLGFGFTLRRTLEVGGAGVKVQVADLLPIIVAWNREHLQNVNGRLLDDPRVEMIIDDVFAVLTHAPRGFYDAVLLDVDNSPEALVDAGNARIYADAGLETLSRALRKGGRAVFWSGNEDRGFEARLQRAGFIAKSVAAKAYPQAKYKTHTLFVADWNG